MSKFLVVFILLLSFNTRAQMMPGRGPLPAIDSLSDNFASHSISAGWKFLHETEKYQSKINSWYVQNGVLKIMPYTSGWYGDFQGPLLYRNVSGDFDVRLKIKVSDKDGELPLDEWSLAGLMIRQAKRTDMNTWQPREENWLFITTGIAQPSGIPVFETKTTNNSLSNLKLRPAKKGWVELRIVRVEASFVLLYRYEGEKWVIADRFYRPLLPPTVQVGMTGYTAWNKVPGELQRDSKKFNETTLTEIPVSMIVSIDDVIFKRPALKKIERLKNDRLNLPYYSPANMLTDFTVSNDVVLDIIGD
jgi:hypothetical protein